jgi:Zn-dependent protease
LFKLYIGRDEAVEIAISVVALSFAMALVFARVDGVLSYPVQFIVFVVPVMVTVGSGFILHEMAHKLVAMYYGAQARFKMWTQGLIFSLLTATIGVLFAAPGAVYIYSNKISVRENGIISIAGSVLNLSVAAFFIALAIASPVRQFFSFLAPWGIEFAEFGIVNGMINVWRFGAAMNIMLALFNMLPIFPLDGSKVFRWSKAAWGGFVLLLLVIGSVVINPLIVLSWTIMLVFFAILSKLLFG